MQKDEANFDGFTKTALAVISTLTKRRKTKLRKFKLQEVSNVKTEVVSDPKRGRNTDKDSTGSEKYNSGKIFEDK